MSYLFQHKRLLKTLLASAALSLSINTYAEISPPPSVDQQKSNDKNEPTATPTAPSEQANHEQKAPLPEGAVITSKEGHFTVKLPNGFTTIDHDIQPIQTEMGEIETINYTSFTDISACMVGSSEYPEALLVFIKGKEKEVLDGAQEGALKNVNGTVVSSEDLKVEKLPARSVEFAAEADGQPLFGKALFILADSRLYHILFISSNHEEINSPEVLKFFQSFKITN